jgi:hypothetical protein
LCASACSVEILVHKILFFLILLPFTVLIFPFLTFHVGTSLFNLNLSDDWRLWRGAAPGQGAPLLNDGQEIAAAVALTLLTAAIAVARYRRSLRQQRMDLGSDRRYRPLTGGRGTALRKRVEELWSQLALPTLATPEVLWFPNVGVLARAMLRDNKAAVAVSTGLWERIDNNDSIAEIILLHELAHVFHRDPTDFARLKALGEVVNRTLGILFRVLGCVVVFLMTQQLIINARPHVGVGGILRQEIMIAGIGLLALSLCPVAASIIRRYVGFITSLVELRADVRAAQWIGTLARFAEILKEHPMVHKSTVRDRARSWFSLELTHLSETERVNLVRSPERLLTPKIEYFAFSLALALLLPLNGLTPLFEGGIFDLAAVIAVSLALMFAVSTMLVLAGGSEVNISLKRLAMLSLALTLFISASQINLYTFTYSLSTIAVEVGLPTSDAPLSGSHYFNDIVSAFHDVWNQWLTIWSRGWILASVLINTAFLMAALAVVKRLMAKRPATRLLLALVTAISGLGVVIDGFDHWRAFVLDATVIGRVCANWADLANRFPGIRFTLGPSLLVLSLLMFIPFGSKGLKNPT